MADIHRGWEYAREKKGSVAKIRQVQCLQFKKRQSKNCCCAFQCSNTPANHPELGYHTFPSDKDAERKRKWISAV